MVRRLNPPHSERIQMFVLKSKYRGDYLLSYTGWCQMFVRNPAEAKVHESMEKASEELETFSEVVRKEMGDDSYGKEESDSIISDLEIVELP